MALSLRQQAKRRSERTRRRLKAVANGRLRLSVYRSDKNISAQIIDDAQGVTVASASSLEGGKGKKGSDIAAASAIALMSLLRCLHPPGGAAALFALGAIFVFGIERFLPTEGDDSQEIGVSEPTEPEHVSARH